MKRVILLVTFAFLLPAGKGAAQTSPITAGALSVRLLSFTSIAGNLGAPQDLTTANDGTGRLFIATRDGTIQIADPAGKLSATPFLNLASSPGVSLFTGGEGGFPGLAFSPNFSGPANVPGSGKFYTFTTETAGPAADFGHPEISSATAANQIVIREWSVSAGNPNLADTTSRVLMRINHPQSNHQGGGLKFGPDGDLYIALGDGGGGNDNSGGAGNNSDGHTNSIGNAQDTSVVFGKILRIDPNGTNSANGQYGIPAGNPFVGSSTAVKEIFAYGLRNPYRISFDRLTGQLLAGDVGQNQREEVDVITNGGNYGWVFREGTRDNTTDSGRSLPGGFNSLAPIGEYTHGDGDSIIGGFVYRGSLLPDLGGKYVFGDLRGRLFYMNASGGLISEFKYDLTGGGVAPPSSLFGFGEDAGGELYALFGGGQVLQIVPEPSVILLLGMGGLFLLRRGRRSV